MHQQAIRRTGVPVTLHHHPAGGSETQLSPQAQLIDVSDRLVDGVTILRGDRWVLVAADDIPGGLDPEDVAAWFVTEGGTKRRVVDVRTYRVDGQIGSYKLLTRA